jgi:hypothetical protein
MDLKDILAALEGRRERPTVRGILSEGEEAYWRSRRIEPTPDLFLRLVSESWTRPAGILSASGFDIIVMDAERAFEKSVEDFGAAEWRAVAMFLGSVMDNPHKRRRRPRKPIGSRSGRPSCTRSRVAGRWSMTNHIAASWSRRSMP